MQAKVGMSNASNVDADADAGVAADSDADGAAKLSGLDHSKNGAAEALRLGAQEPVPPHLARQACLAGCRRRSLGAYINC